MSGLAMVLLLLAAGTWLSAMVGAAVVAVIKKDSGIVTDLILGFAAGVILMVSFVELLHPAIHMSEIHSSLPSWVVVPGAFFVGVIATFLLDLYIGSIKSRKNTQACSPYKQGLVLFGALSAHNIPEGLALGILLGAQGRFITSTALWAVVPLVIAIALHKFPEGAAIAVAFNKDGMTRLRSFLVGQASGFFGFVAAIIGFAIATNIDPVLPYAMAFAGGAMVWVAVHELIPESKRRKDARPYMATMGIVLGVLLMLFVDTTLHNHHGGHGCCPGCSRVEMQFEADMW